MSRIQYEPDWKRTWTRETAEQELSGFVFLGTGWYYDVSGDTILVLPTDDDKRFQFLVYNGGDPALAFNQIVNLPVRTNSRG